MRPFFSKASGTSQPDHHFFPFTFESLWFHSQHQMKNRSFRGPSKSSIFACHVDQETDSEPEMHVWKVYRRMLLGPGPVEGRQGIRIGQKEL